MKPIAVHIFNPWHDMALASFSPNYQPRASAIKMAEDLALLPRWIAEDGDVLLLPDFSACTIVDGQVKSTDFPTPGVSYEFKPWGWDQLIHSQLCSQFPTLELPSIDYLNVVRKLSSRQLAVETLGALHKRNPGVFIGESFFCTDLSSIANLAKKYPRLLMKQLWSSSGKGLRRLDGNFEVPLQNWCARSIQLHGGVVVEPRYERIMDFAMEFIAEKRGVSFCGYSVFLTSDTGKYAGNIIDSEENLERSILKQYGESDNSIFQCIKESLIELLSASIAPFYQGPFGVDMMLIRTNEGFVKIHPCVEINLRFNMGQLATKLSSRLLLSGKRGVFRIEYFANPKMLQDRYLLLSSLPGFQLLAPVHQHSCYLAYMLMDSETCEEGI